MTCEWYCIIMTCEFISAAGDVLAWVRHMQGGAAANISFLIGRGQIGDKLGADTSEDSVESGRLLGSRRARKNYWLAGRTLRLGGLCRSRRSRMRCIHYRWTPTRPVVPTFKHHTVLSSMRSLVVGGENLNVTVRLPYPTPRTSPNTLATRLHRPPSQKPLAQLRR